MAKFPALSLSAILLLATLCAASRPGRAEPDDPATCPDPRPSAAAPAAEVPGPYVPPKFRMGTKKEFKDGALYDLNGQLLCVLKGTPQAYVHTGAPPAGPITEAYCAQVEQDIAAGNLTDMESLNLTNNDLLRRLIWLYGEGGCNPVDAACAPTASDCGPAPSGQYGSIYYAYVIKNLRKLYRSDDGMLRGACRDATRSFYEDYFVNGAGNTRSILAALKEPARWLPNPAPAGAASCGRNDLCWARSRVSRCLQDLIHAQRDSADGDTPLAGPLNAWLGEVGPRSVDAGRVCPKRMPRILVHSWAGLPMLECFHKY